MRLGGQLVRIRAALSFSLAVAPVVLMGLVNMAGANAAQSCACSGYSLRIVDETRSARAQPAAPGFADIADPSFREFVKTVSDHVLAAACGGPIPPQPADAAEADVQLLFIKRPLVKPAATFADDRFAANQPGERDLRRLDSPWLKLAISREPRCRIRAVFLWNERQFLRDQAAMEAGHAVGEGPPISLDGEMLAQASEEYAEEVVLRSAEAGRAALQKLSARIPPEILWLYRHAVQSTLADFSVFAMAALNTTMLKARPGYVSIVIALFDRCLGSAAGRTEHYDSVVNLTGVVDLKAYRVRLP